MQVMLQSNDLSLSSTTNDARQSQKHVRTASSNNDSDFKDHLNRSLKSDIEGDNNNSKTEPQNPKALTQNPKTLTQKPLTAPDIPSDVKNVLQSESLINHVDSLSVNSFVDSPVENEDLSFSLSSHHALVDQPVLLASNVELMPTLSQLDESPANDLVEEDKILLPSDLTALFTLQQMGTPSVQSSSEEISSVAALLGHLNKSQGILKAVPEMLNVMGDPEEPSPGKAISEFNALFSSLEEGDSNESPAPKTTLSINIASNAPVAAVVPEEDSTTSFVSLTRPVDSPTSTARGLLMPTEFAQGFGQPGWDSEVGEKVLYMAAKNLTFADIRLDPPELGSLQVRVTVQNEQAQVAFISPHVVVREALDSHATRLREMFAEQGLLLADVHVSDQERQHSGKGDESSPDDTDFIEGESVTVLGEYLVEDIRLVDDYV